jgi:hypothetical protein
VRLKFGDKPLQFSGRLVLLLCEGGEAKLGFSTMRYPTRNDAFSKARTWAIEDAFLRWDEEGGASGGMPLSDIAAIQLEYAPTRPEPNRYRCRVVLKSGKTLEFFNRTYRGVYDFADTSVEYVRFVEALHAALRAQGPGCKFTAGTSEGRYMANVGCLAFVALLLGVVAIALLMTGLFLIVIIKMVLIVLYGPVALRWLRRNKPRQYAPEAIPKEVLPVTL